MPDPDLRRDDLEQLFPEVTLTVEEVAGRLRRCEVPVTRAIKRGRLHALSGLGRPYVLTRSAVIAWALGADDDAPPPVSEPPAPTAAQGSARGSGDPAAQPRRIPQAAIDRRLATMPKRRST